MDFGVQPYFDPTLWNMEDNLNIVLEMEDNLNFNKIEDDLILFENGRWPQICWK